jgi:hypothetical protein
VSPDHVQQLGQGILSAHNTLVELAHVVDSPDGSILLRNAEHRHPPFGLVASSQNSNVHLALEFTLDNRAKGVRHWIRPLTMVGLRSRLQFNVELAMRIASKFTTEQLGVRAYNVPQSSLLTIVQMVLAIDDVVDVGNS